MVRWIFQRFSASSRRRIITDGSSSKRRKIRSRCRRFRKRRRHVPTCATTPASDFTQSMSISRMSQMTALGADWWNDSGVPDELSEAVALGAVGGTSNPVIVSQAVKAQPALCNPIIDRIVAQNPADTEDDIAWKLIHTLAIDAASRLQPVYDATGGAKGFVSAQVNPKYYP